jgi:hypothetical protein
VVWRLAPDDALIDTYSRVDDNETGPPIIDDVHAIVVPDGGWRVVIIDTEDFDAKLRPRIEWTVDEGLTNQGLVLGVPAKIRYVETPAHWFSDSEGEPYPHWEILCAAPYAHELDARLAEVLGG